MRAWITLTVCRAWPSNELCVSVTECRTPLEPLVSAVSQVSPPSPHKLSDVAVRDRGPRRSSRGLFPSVDSVSSSVSLTSFSLLHSFVLPVFSEHTVIGYEPVGVFLPPGGIFYTIFFWNPNVSWAFFTCSAIWRLGRLWVIEVKGHQMHFWMWSISWSAINDYLVNLSQCVSPKWSQMV